MKSELFKRALGAAFVASLLTLVACSPTADGSLLTDEASDPNSHSLSTDPSATELFLKADNTNLGTITSARFAELSGDCFTSTYPSHKITATVNGASAATFNMSNGNTTAATSGTCKNGRYDLVIKGSSLRTGTNNIVLTITAYDSASNPSTNGNGMTTFTVIRSD